MNPAHNDPHVVRTSSVYKFYPPKLREHFVNLVEFSTPTVTRFVLDNELDETQLADVFDSAKLKMDSTKITVSHGSIHAAGFTIAGWYPVAALARWLRTSSERFLAETNRYTNKVALLRYGKYFLEVVPNEQDTLDGLMRTGVLRKLSHGGNELWQNLLSYHIDCSQLQ